MQVSWPYEGCAVLPNPSAHWPWYGVGFARTSAPHRRWWLCRYSSINCTSKGIVHNRRQRLGNRRLRSICIVQIQHSIGFQKFYASVNSVFRSKRLFLPFVVSTCGFLSNRRKAFLRRLRIRCNLTTSRFTPHVQHNCTSIISMLKK